LAVTLIDLLQQMRRDWMITNGVSGRMQKDSFVCFKALFQQLSKGTEENHKNLSHLISLLTKWKCLC